MSLSEAMIDLAKEMEDVAHRQNLLTSDHAKTWAKMLRMLAKTVEKEEPKAYQANTDLASRLAAPSDLALAQRALDRLHKKKQRMEEITMLEEYVAPSMTCCMNGPEANTWIELPPDAQANSTYMVGGHTYRLGADCKLYLVNDK